MKLIRSPVLPAVAALLVLGATAGSVAAADESLPHSGRVVIVAGGNIDIPAGEQADAVVVLGGRATVAGTVNALVVVEGSAVIRDATLETLAVVNGSVRLADTRVVGDIHRLNAQIDSTNVDVGGTVRDLTGDAAAFGIFLGAAAVILWIGIAVATLLVGLLAAGLAARQVRAATTLISEETGLTVLAGLVAMIAPPFVAVLLMVTLVGIPAGVGLLLVLWPALAFVGYLVAAIWLGEWILGRRGGAVRAERPYAAVVVGLAAGFVLGLVPLVTAALSVLGLGAVVLSAYRTLRGPRAAEPLPAPVPA